MYAYIVEEIRRTPAFFFSKEAIIYFYVFCMQSKFVVRFI